MKRTGFIIEQVADIDNLRLAFYKAQKGKRAKQEVIKYRKRLESNLSHLREQLLNGKISVGKYKLFNIYDPKERVVCAAAFDERVLHHAIMNICSPYFERNFINTTYANRIDKGAYKALEHAHKAMARYKYVAKLDVRKYFDSIDHSILIKALTRLFKDKLFLLILEQIIDSYEVNIGKGLPIGNLTSQYFANYYLSSLDHFAKEKLQIPVYVRYMDDILFFGNDRVIVKQQVEEIKNYVLQQLNLELKSPIIVSTKERVSFLGYCLHNRCISLTLRSKRRFQRKYKIAEKNISSGKWSEDDYQKHITPLIAFTKHAYTKRYRQKIINR